MTVDSLRQVADQALEHQRQAIEQSRQHDFDALLITEFRQATDSIASQLKAGTTPSDSLMLTIAKQWYQQTH